MSEFMGGEVGMRRCMRFRWCVIVLREGREVLVHTAGRLVLVVGCEGCLDEGWRDGGGGHALVMIGEAMVGEVWLVLDRRCECRWRGPSVQKVGGLAVWGGCVPDLGLQVRGRDGVVLAREVVERLRPGGLMLKAARRVRVAIVIVMGELFRYAAVRRVHRRGVREVLIL